MVRFCPSRLRIWRSSILGVLLFCAGYAVPAESVQQLNDRGLDQMKSGNYAAAAESFASARRILPQDANLQRNLALAYNAWGVELAKQSNYDQAIERLQTARQTLPGETLIASNMTAIRINWATELMDQKKHEDAETQLARANAEAANDDERREIAKRRAYNAYTIAEELLAKGSRERARQKLTDALDIDPDCIHAQIKLAEMLYEEGDTAMAIEYWRAAAAADPKIPGLADMIDKATRELSVESGFDNRSTRQFKVSYEGKVNEQTARAAMQILSRALYQIGRDLRYNSKRPFAVVLYSPDQYRAATEAPGWSSGLYDGKIRVPLKSNGSSEADRRALTTTLRHELTHAVVIELAGSKVPAWLNEGLAMYYEREPADRDPRAKADRLAILKMIGGGERISVIDLPASFTKMTDSAKVERAYLLSRSFVQWMAERYRPYKFRELLASLGAGTPIDDALIKVYGKNLDSLDTMWQTTFR